MNSKSLIINPAVIGALVVFTSLILLQDLIAATVNQYNFYFSEALLFSSFWWLFLPLLWNQYRYMSKENSVVIYIKILAIVLPVLMHIGTFSVFVYILSHVFYSHTYSIEQTLLYTLSNYLYLLLFLYSIPMLIYLSFRKQREGHDSNDVPTPPKDNTFIVSQGSKYIPVAVTDIMYLTADTPYINIHLVHKKFLYKETLKGVLKKLDSSQFLRIHKSVIINHAYVQSYLSRKNGDYDITMADGAILRMSRNYAAAFKEQFVK